MRRTFFAAAAATAVAGKKVEIDAMKHDIQQVYQKNFDSVIGTSLPLTVSAVLYFKGSNRGDAAFLDVYNEVAKKTKKMLKVAAMDCDDAPKHCDRVGVKDTPHVQIYPQTPRPHFKYDGAMEADALMKLLFKLVPSDKITTFKATEDFVAWKKKNVTKPKMMLFSDKKKPPTMWKALSTDSVFMRTVDFGFAGSEDDAIITEAGAKKKKMPAVMMVAKGKTMWVKEKDLTFLGLHEWINVNSESGMGDTVKGVDGQSEVEVEEPEYEKVRELHAKSQHELCFKQKNVCVIYLSQGPLDDKVADKLVTYESKFAPKTDRGVKYSWMWLDVTVETDFKAVLDAEEKKQAEKNDRDVEPWNFPTMIFVKPPKKKREEKMLSYIRMDADKKVNDDSVSAMVERVSGGATYARADVPKFTVRQKPAKKGDKKKGKEEL